MGKNHFDDCLAHVAQRAVNRHLEEHKSQLEAARFNQNLWNWERAHRTYVAPESDLSVFKRVQEAVEKQQQLQLEIKNLKRKEPEMQVFQYVVVYKPTPAEQKDGQKAAVVVPLTSVLAKDTEQAKFLAARAVPDAFASKSDQLDIQVRPF